MIKLFVGGNLAQACAVWTGRAHERISEGASVISVVLLVVMTSSVPLKLQQPLGTHRTGLSFHSC